MRRIAYLAPLIGFGLLACARQAPGPTVTTTSAEIDVNKGDVTLANDVRAALRDDARVATDLPNIQVSVKDGIVTLRGTVSARDREWILYDVSRLVWMSHVNDRLTVFPERPPRRY